MVRKWSYIIPVNINCSKKSSSTTSSKYSFKVFKTTTRFKKYAMGLTKFMRRSLAKRKHKTNWLTMSYVLQKWIFFYLRNKQFNRYYQALGMFKYNSISISTIFFTRQQELFTIKSGISILSCSKNILKSFFFNEINEYTSPIHNHPSTIMLSRDINELGCNSEINPGLLIYDNIAYPYNYNDNFFKNQNFLLKIKSNTFNWILKFIWIIYKIMIKMTLFLIKF